MSSRGPRLDDFRRAALLGGYALASTRAAAGFEALAAAEEPRELCTGSTEQVQAFLSRCAQTGRPTCVATHWRDAVRIESSDVRLAFTARITQEGFELVALDMPDFGEGVDETVLEGISEGSGRCTRPDSSPGSPGGSPPRATTSKPR